MRIILMILTLGLSEYRKANRLSLLVAAEVAERRRLEAERHNRAREQAIREQQARLLFRWLWRLAGNAWTVEKWRRRRAQQLMAIAAAVNVGTIGHIDHGADQ